MTDPIGIPSGWECLAAIAWGFIPDFGKDREGRIAALLERFGPTFTSAQFGLSFLDYDWSVAL